jgi:arsenite-transporting ATPase
VARVIFHIGKGGVGKSTLAALAALAAAERGQRVLLLSLDPAHNLSDIFGQRFGDAPLSVQEGLRVMEADVDAWIRRSLRETEQRMRAAYSYLTAINLEHHFRVLKHSPGLEEFALRRVFEHAYERWRDHDLLLVDMPPTALATRFFASPTVSAAWTEHLLALRRDIKDRREMITRVKLGKMEVETDRVLRTLEEEQRKNAALRSFFSDSSRCSVRLVLNPDPLSWKEGERIASALGECGIALRDVLVNKSGSAQATVPASLIALPRVHVSRLDPVPVGLPALRAALPALPAEFLDE